MAVAAQHARRERFVFVQYNQVMDEVRELRSPPSDTSYTVLTAIDGRHMSVAMRELPRRVYEVDVEAVHAMDERRAAELKRRVERSDEPLELLAPASRAFAIDAIRERAAQCPAATTEGAIGGEDAGAGDAKRNRAVLDHVLALPIKWSAGAPEPTRRRHYLALPESFFLDDREAGEPLDFRVAVNLCRCIERADPGLAGKQPLVFAATVVEAASEAEVKNTALLRTVGDAVLRARKTRDGAKDGGDIARLVRLSDDIMLRSIDRAAVKRNMVPRKRKLP